ncbi:MAG TPA: signal peptidase I [Acidimicrobiia bacterium]|nr:signal peptidase I [Acidimicrobiia bacterium]
MFPAFGPGDRLQLNSCVGEPQRADIVLYRATFLGGESQQMVHRVVGLPGERLEAAPDGRVLVNGAPQVQDYLPTGTITYLSEPVEVPSDHWFLMGDNRERSSDSRVTGPIPRADILAKVTKIDRIKRPEEDNC